MSTVQARTGRHRQRYENNLRLVSGMEMGLFDFMDNLKESEFRGRIFDALDKEGASIIPVIIVLF
ncbi:hypothetical protein CK203_067492 [Vitis vinifera]|uniref:Uncharacterized protein n=1 Tax=Vitis vinifera TaxID=29760 RepID=A0A438EBH3_VITVI|nr:hypothetical protein CK203_067492 [Vitis vinifera]